MKFIKRLVLATIVVLLCIGGVLTYNGYTLYKKTITEIPLAQKVNEVTAKDSYTTLDEIPKIYIDAVIAAEDHRFYKHGGIDIISIGRAIKVNFKEKSLVEGGSTITQQLAKNLYFSSDKNLTRKIAEMFTAFDIEKNYDKNKILELYINSIYYGSGYYCIKDASIGYFNKLPGELNDYECTLLAGIPNAPSVYSLNDNPDLAHQRQKQVLDKMTEEKYISENEAEMILAN